VLRAAGLLHDRVDLHLKVDNVGNARTWDAGRDLLYPQRGLQAMLWLTVGVRGGRPLGG